MMQNSDVKMVSGNRMSLTISCFKSDPVGCSDGTNVFQYRWRIRICKQNSSEVIFTNKRIFSHIQRYWSKSSLHHSAPCASSWFPLSSYSSWFLPFLLPLLLLLLSLCSRLHSANILSLAVSLSPLLIPFGACSSMIFSLPYIRSSFLLRIPPPPLGYDYANLKLHFFCHFKANLLLIDIISQLHFVTVFSVANNNSA